MVQKSPESGKKDDSAQELTALLQILWVETTHEAHFEDHFICDFRQRVERELVCRPARSVLWEHIVMFLDSLGMRRVALGASAFSLGALCVGAFAWQQSEPGKSAATTQLCELESRANSLRPGVSQQVVRTAVHTGKSRFIAKNNIIVLADEEEDPFYVGSAAEDETLYVPLHASFAEDEKDWPGM